MDPDKLGQRLLVAVRNMTALSSLVAGRGVLVFSSFGLNIVAARLMSPAEFGLFSIFVAAVTLSGLVGAIEAGQGAARLLASILRPSDRETSEIAWSATVVAAAGGLLSSVGLIAFLVFAVSDRVFGSPLAYLLVVLCAVASALRSVFSRLFIVLGRYRVAAALDGASANLLLLGAFVILGANGISPNFMLVLGVYAGTLILEAILAMLFLVGNPSWIKPTFSRSTVGRIVVVSAPLWVAGVSIYAANQLPMMILGVSGDLNGAAVFSVSLKVSGLLGIIVLLTNQLSVRPILQLVSQGSFRQLKKLSQQRAMMSGIATFLAFGSLLIFGREMLGSSFGEYYVDAYIPLLVLCFAIVVESLCGPSQAIVSLSGRGKHVMYASIASVVVCAVSCVILIPDFGMNGAALAICVPQISRAVFYYYIASQIFTSKIPNL